MIDPATVASVPIEEDDERELVEATQKAREAVAWQRSVILKVRAKGGSFREIGRLAQMDHTNVLKIVRAAGAAEVTDDVGDQT